jgi:prepilin-type N-terminal cleavage/methylation domain-containing protein
MRNAKGFTLIELLVVVAIVAILAAALIPNILNARARALQAAAQSYARDILIALESIQSTFSQVDWRETALGNGHIQIVTSGALLSYNTWRDGARNPVTPPVTVDFSDFLKAPGRTGIVEAGVVLRGTPSQPVICVIQRVGTTYNAYALYPDDNQFRSALRIPATLLSYCP